MASYDAGGVRFAIGAWRVAAADFDNDGDQDLAVANQAASLSILRNTGAGAFAPRHSVVVGAESNGIDVGDFDSDGNADIAIGVRGLPEVRVLFGDGSGGFAPPSVINVQTTANTSGWVPTLRVAVLDRDGAQDVQ